MYRYEQLLEWVWLFDRMVSSAVIVWTAILFFKRRSIPCLFLLIAALLYTVPGIAAQVIYWLGSIWGLSMTYAGGSEPQHIAVWHFLLNLSFCGFVLFHAVLVLVVRRLDDPAQRIAELETALQEDLEQRP